ncbi:O-methyltransferase-domain-containing protein [Aspergillus californicus]
MRCPNASSLDYPTTMSSQTTDPVVVASDILSSVVQLPCLATLSDLGVFEKLSDGPLTAAQLAQQCSADHWLVVRLMRAATTWGVIVETGTETYAATATSDILATPAYAAGLHVSQRIAKILSGASAYLKENQYRNPAGPDNSIFQYSMGTKLKSFEFLSQNKEAMHDFNLFMTIQHTNEQWTERFDIASLILDGVTIDQTVPLVVDVAGGIGKDLQLVKKALPPTPPGSLVLEDQAVVIDGVPADMHDPDLKYVKHDFFTPQPVKGARIYTLKHILHNWPDEKCLEILGHTVDSMTAGYSKVWILDRVVPETGADKALVGLDITMMGIHGALERTRVQWQTLLAQAGLRISSVSTSPDSFSLIECVLEA